MNSRNSIQSILHKRSNVLRPLAEQSHTKPELIDTVGKSRSTIDRSIEELKDVGCVEYHDGKYNITTKGRLALTKFTEYSTFIDSLNDAGEILNHLPAESSISCAFLNDATVHPANPHVRGAALQKRNKLLQSSRQMTELTPTAHPSYPSILLDFVRERSIDLGIIMEDVVFQSLSDMKSEQVSSLVSHNKVDLYTVSDLVPYSLWITEQKEKTYAGITIYKDGGIQGLLMNDTPEAITWAKDLYQKYRTSANLLASN